MRGDGRSGRWQRGGEKVGQKGVDFGGDKFDDELDWAVRCKGCRSSARLALKKQHSRSRTDPTLSQCAYGRVTSVLKESVWDITAGFAGVSGRTSSSRARVTRFMCASAARPSRRPSAEPSRIRMIFSDFSNSRISPKRM